jgi:hypothetical protein
MAKLTAAKRNKLPASTFAGPGRSYPINDLSHARNALARASGNASSELKATIRAKVHRKFPGIKMHDEGPHPKMHGGEVRHRMDKAPRH